MAGRYARRAKKVDANQQAIVDALNALPGVQAVSIGAPLDLIVGTRGRTYLIEIKNPDGKGKRGKSWETQQKFISGWPGQVAVCETLEDVLEAISLYESIGL